VVVIVGASQMTHPLGASWTLLPRGRLLHGAAAKSTSEESDHVRLGPG
jgi:hypothetical protein